MKFWDGAEVEKSVYPNYRRTLELVGGEIEEALQYRSLRDVDWEFCYIPIIMGPNFAEFYPARTKADKNEKKFYHSPKLDFAIFQVGTDAQCKAEYVRGIGSALESLESIGLVEDQLYDFGRAVSNLLEAINDPADHSG